MKRIQIVLIIMVFAFGLAAPSKAQVGLKKVAQSTMNFLLVNVSPKAAAMGETSIAVSKGAESIFSNPAAVSETAGAFDVKVYMTQWIADINYMAGAVVWNAGNVGSLGFSALWVDYGTIHGTSLISVADQTIYPLGYKDNGEVEDLGAFAFGLTYGAAISDRFLIGGSIRYAGQNLGESFTGGQSMTQNRATKVIFDAGVKYYTGFKDFRFAMAIRNFSSNLKREEISEPLPLLFTMGMALDMLEFFKSSETSQNELTLAVDFLHSNNYTERINFGLEYTFVNMLALRGGYQANHDVASWSAGVGLNVQMNGNTVTFDYSYSNFEIFQQVNRFSLGLAF